MTVKEAFESIVGYAPYDHQARAWTVLAQGKPLVLRAPTGSGKTEAVFLPFAASAISSNPLRLLYALPLRSLANQLKERLERYATRLGRRDWRIRLQHGQVPESVLFAADIVVTTVDQLIASYACTPLTLPLRHGNIPAGAVTSSFLVFDEVHLFDPLRALQATRLICHRLHRLGIPFAILSATLPDCILEFFREKLGCEIVEAGEEVVQRNVHLHWQGQPLEGADIVEAMSNEHQHILVVVNTVERAIALFDQIRNRANQQGYEAQLLHSRFLPSDRQRKEDWIMRRFGKETLGTKSLLIATQVVEAGLDISADCVLTELAPIDALIQRAGRCARWGGEGTVRIFSVASAAPYEETLVRETEKLLQDNLPTTLNWSMTKEWVNRVLSARYQAALTDENHSRSIALLSEAAFTGNRQKVARSVRDVDTVEVSIHDNPASLSKDALRLPTISVHIGVVRKWLQEAREKGASVQRVEVDSFSMDGLPRVAFRSVSVHDLCLGDRLVFPTCALTYDEEYGLRWGESTKPFEPLHLTPRETLTIAPHKEPWLEHAQKVAEWMKQLLEQEHLAVSSLARILCVGEDEVRRAALTAAYLHDFGKLTVEWQRKASVPLEAQIGELLAHTEERNYGVFPPHATVSAYALWEALKDALGDSPLTDAVLLAIAHHHSVRAREVPKYNLHPLWRDALSSLPLPVQIDERKVIKSQQGSTKLPQSFPPLERERLYTAYVLVARWLRLADRAATEGSWDAIFRYEDWFGRL